MIWNLITLLFVYPVWVLIHEGTHVVLAKYYGCEILSFKPYPNTSTGRFTWGSVTWRGLTTGPQRGIIAFGPRVPAALAVVLLAVAAHFALPTPVLLLLSGGAVDQAVNSLGFHERSDLRVWCTQFDHDPWLWRIGSYVMLAVFVGYAVQSFV